MNPLVIRFMRLNMIFFKKSCSAFSQLNSIDTEGLRMTAALYGGENSRDTTLKKLQVFDQQDKLDRQRAELEFSASNFDEFLPRRSTAQKQP